MKAPHHGKFLTACLAICVSLSLVPSAGAILITFESAQGYTAGSFLNGQPSSGTQWQGGGGFAGANSGYTVVDGAGVGGSAGARSPAAFVAGSQFFIASAADLGVAEKSPVGQYSFGLSVTMNGNPNGDFNTLARIELFGTGSSQAVELRIFGNGRVQYDDGTSLVNVRTGSGSNFALAQNATAAFEGIINYDTSTYSLSVNGVSQGSAIPFSDVFTHSASTVGRFEIEHFSEVAYRQITLDNISMAVVPEPGALGLVGAGAALLLAAGWRSGSMRGRFRA